MSIKSFYILLTFNFLGLQYTNQYIDGSIHNNSIENTGDSIKNTKHISKILNDLILQTLKVVVRNFENIKNPFKFFFDCKFYLHNLKYLQLIDDNLLNKNDKAWINILIEKFQEEKKKIFKILDDELKNISTLIKDKKMKNLLLLIDVINDSKNILAQVFYQDFPIKPIEDFFLNWNYITTTINELPNKNIFTEYNVTQGDPYNHLEYVIPLDIIIPYLIINKYLYDEGNEEIIKTYENYNNQYNKYSIEILKIINNNFKTTLKNPNKIQDLTNFISYSKKYMINYKKFLQIFLKYYFNEFFFYLKFFNFGKYNLDPNLDKQSNMKFIFDIINYYENNHNKTDFKTNPLMEGLYEELLKTREILKSWIINIINIQNKFIELLKIQEQFPHINLLNESYFFMITIVYFIIFYHLHPEHIHGFNNILINLNEAFINNDSMGLINLSNQLVEFLENNDSIFQLFFMENYYKIIIENQKNIIAIYSNIINKINNPLPPTPIQEDINKINPENYLKNTSEIRINSEIPNNNH